MAATIAFDNSAARWLCLLICVGKIRRLSVLQLWVQEARRNTEFELKSVNALGRRWYGGTCYRSVEFAF